MGRLKKFFSDKRVSFLIILIGVIGRTIQLLFFYNIRVDRSYQLMAMQNFTSGHGVSLSTVFPSDLSATVYEPLIKWPPGYSLLIAPFYLLFNKDYLLASMLVEILFAVLLILSCRQVLSLLSVPVYQINGFTLLSAFFIYDFYVITNADAITVTFFIIAVYLSLTILKAQSNWLKNSIVLSLLLFACGLLKYLFIPVIFLVPVYVFGYGFFNNSRVCKQSGIFIFCVLAICISALLIYQKHIAGAATYISEPSRGFFPKNLLSFFPFLPASFVKPGTVELVSQTDAVYKFFQVIHLLMFGMIILAFIHVFRKQGVRNVSLNTNFFYISLFVISGICIVLMLLSAVVSKEQMFPGAFWTYVEEARYYGVAVVLIQLAIFALYNSWGSKKYVRYIFLFLLFLLSVEIIHGIFFDAKRISKIGKEEYGWQYEDKFQKYADSILKSEQGKYAAKKAIITGSSYYLNHRVSLYSQVPILSDAGSVNDPSSLKTKEPVLLLVILSKKNLGSFNSFLSNRKNVAGQFRDFYFYTIYVRPD